MKRLPFWERVKCGTPEECWPWQGYVHWSGHGLTSLDSLMLYASRKAWILTHGPIRDGACVNHRCDNALCCNPAHLYLGTRSDNMIDRWEKIPAAERSARGRPHVLTPDQLAQLWQRRREGATLKSCAAEFGVHMATICRYITTIRKQRIAKLRQSVRPLAKIT